MIDGKALEADVEFLLDRLIDFERDIEDEALAREWSGHVSPAIARTRDALAYEAAAPVAPVCDAGQAPSTCASPQVDGTQPVADGAQKRMRDLTPDEQSMLASALRASTTELYAFPTTVAPMSTSGEMVERLRAPVRGKNADHCFAIALQERAEAASRIEALEALVKEQAEARDAIGIRAMELTDEVSEWRGRALSAEAALAKAEPK